MSWDIVLLKSKQIINSIKDLDENQLEITDFYSIFKHSFKKITKKGNFIEIIEKDYTIEFYVDDKLSSNFMLQLYGENGIYAIIEIAKKYNWQIYDSGIDGMIDLNNPENNGFGNHKKYIEQILKKDE